MPDYPISPLPVILLLTDELFSVREMLMAAYNFYEINDYPDQAKACITAIAPVNALIARRVHESGNLQRNWIAERPQL